MDCGICTIAMLTGLPYEKILADVPQYKETSDFDWMRYVISLGFQVDQVNQNDPPVGPNLYCGVITERDGKTFAHALAVDESGRIFDPSINAPEPGKFTLRECVEYGTFRIRYCFAVRDRRLM